MKITVIIILVCLVSLSCSTSRKMALSCPAPARQHESNAALNHPRSIKKIHVGSQKNNKLDNSFTRDAYRYTLKPDKVADRPDELNKKVGTGLVQTGAPGYPAASLPIIPGADYEDTCAQAQDTLYLKNGTSAAGKLLRKTRTEYRFQRSDGVVFNFSADAVEKVIPETVVTPSPQMNQSNSQKTERLSLAGFIAGFAGWLSALIPWALGLNNYPESMLVFILPACTLAGLIMSISALVRMKKNPADYKRKGWAVGGVFFGLFGIIGTVIFILLMLMAYQ